MNPSASFDPCRHPTHGLLQGPRKSVALATRKGQPCCKIIARRTRTPPAGFGDCVDDRLADLRDPRWVASSSTQGWLPDAGFEHVDRVQKNLSQVFLVGNRATWLTTPENPSMAGDHA